MSKWIKGKRIFLFLFLFILWKPIRTLYSFLIGWEENENSLFYVLVDIPTDRPNNIGTTTKALVAKWKKKSNIIYHKLNSIGNSSKIGLTTFPSLLGKKFTIN